MIRRATLISTAAAMLAVTLSLASCSDPRSAEPWTIDLGEEGEVELLVRPSALDTVDQYGWLDEEERQIRPTRGHRIAVVLPPPERSAICSFADEYPTPWLSVRNRYDVESLGSFQQFTEHVPSSSQSGIFRMAISDLRANPETVGRFNDLMPSHSLRAQWVFSDAENFILSCTAEYDDCKILIRIATETSIFDRLQTAYPLTDESLSSCMAELLAYGRSLVRAHER